MTEVMGGASKLLVINSANPPNQKRLDIWTPLRPLPFVPRSKEQPEEAEAAASVAQEVLDSLLPGSSAVAEGSGASGDGSGGGGGEGGAGGGEKGGKRTVVGRYLSSSDVQERRVRELNQQVLICLGGEGTVGGSNEGRECTTVDLCGMTRHATSDSVLRQLA